MTTATTAGTRTRVDSNQNLLANQLHNHRQ
jgi:hypothetical protein